MAQFGLAIYRTLQNEGGYYENHKTGEVANMGITIWLLRSLGMLPNLPRSTPATDMEKMYIHGLSIDTASNLYLVHFWNPQRCGQIVNQDVANKYFDMCVNMGPGQATKIIQRACNTLTQEEPLKVDAAIGPKTLDAINDSEPNALLAQIKEEGKLVYKEIANNDPNKADNLPGWLKRLDKA